MSMCCHDVMSHCVLSLFGRRHHVLRFGTVPPGLDDRQLLSYRMNIPKSKAVKELEREKRKEDSKVCPCIQALLKTELGR